MPYVPAPQSLALYVLMRLLLISIFCVIIFFPSYWLFHPIMGPNWGSGVSIVLCWLLLPYFLLKQWNSTQSKVLIAGNYLLAIMVLAFTGWVLYRWLIVGEELQGSVRLLGVYLFGAVFYLAQGRMPYQKQAEESAEKNI